MSVQIRSWAVRPGGLGEALEEFRAWSVRALEELGEVVDEEVPEGARVVVASRQRVMCVRCGRFAPVGGTVRGERYCHGDDWSCYVRELQRVLDVVLERREVGLAGYALPVVWRAER